MYVVYKGTDKPLRFALLETALAVANRHFEETGIAVAVTAEGKRQAYDVTVRRLCNGADYTLRLFCIDEDAACKAATERVRFSIGMRASKLRELHEQGIAVFRIISCEVSADQSRKGV